MDEVNYFLGFLGKNAKRAVKVQTVWAKVQKVDWNAKTMDCTGMEDGLAYYDVSLGLGSLYRKPEQDSKCLIGIVGSGNTEAFLIDAENISEVQYVQGDVELEIKTDNKVKIKNGQTSLKEVFQSLKDLLVNFKVITQQGPNTALDPGTITALTQFEIQFKQLLN